MNKKIEQFIEIFAQENQKHNLCKFDTKEAFMSRHIMDSFESGQFLGGAKKVMDLGTGGGLPGVVLAIQYPDKNLTLVDSTHKKCASIGLMIDYLELTNITVICERAENLAHNPIHREKYDVVVARALAPLPVLLEYASGFIHTGGTLIAYKGPKYMEELEQSKREMAEFEMEMEKIHHYKLPNDEIDRVILIFKKTKQLKDIYPRQNAKKKIL
ncbi:MAG: Ribosomal RNA small subunit methyltransferase G [uncultured bacterium]|nr:MAG: Ribosomal RNA small subunit methyltransferase G [uncultured bacterium]OGJ47525.1 MAG: 16S rRNA (guanine(527)-N(7))-methyltransferase RsmG [Candidatus Peregrinibacteria bacterium RIFOXYA2_FULL_41_18]OGJ48930.1 MAG: 16S rRNA (guanine(527)-N(7))-methyltransferase RsmG [Candidatus Peregrinibacteria bacterium RIFOXYB12_FULL_41_12]OGJ51496.1 MAG: 16S rRNA (guanine(527)-N(7))-methyltransferase RsmG [Candidatus Peregrinibacteria bacterium RIFOXYB2_FULL_41_88]OGJ52601.1 MAG: 16S rRNA (guanine(52